MPIQKDSRDSQLPLHVSDAESAESDPKEPNKLRFSWMEIYSALVAATSFLCIGQLRAFTSPLIAGLKTSSPEIFNSTSMSQNEAISWIASAPPLASFVGTVVAGPFLQYLGRQKTLLLHTIPYITGWVLIGFAEEIGLLITGRTLIGLAAGISTSSTPLYVSECVRAEVRGMLGFLPSMMLALGVLVGFSCSTIDVDWRTLSFIMGSMPLLLLVGTLTIPESPIWFISVKKDGAAAGRSVRRLRKGTDEDEIEEEIKALEACLPVNQRNRRKSVVSIASKAVVSYSKRISNFVKMLKQREIWLPAVIAVGLMFFQQFSGANVVIYFLSVILMDAEPSIERIEKVNGNSSVSDHHDHLAMTGEELLAKEFTILDHNFGAVIVAGVQFLAFFLSLPLIDKMGRKILLIISAVMMSSSLGVLGLYFYCNENARFSPSSDNDSFFNSFVLSTYNWLPLTCLSAFIASYSIGFGPVPFLIMSEIFPSRARSYLCSLTSFMNHFFLFIVIKMFPMSVDWIRSYGTFWIFAGSSLLSIMMIVLIVPETKGKNLQEIEESFRKNPPVEEKELEGKAHLLRRRRDSYDVGLQ